MHCLPALSVGAVCPSGCTVCLYCLSALSVCNDTLYAVGHQYNTWLSLYWVTCTLLVAELLLDDCQDSNRGSEGCSVLDLLRHVQGMWQSQALTQCVLGMPLQLLPVGTVHSVLRLVAGPLNQIEISSTPALPEEDFTP